VAATRLGRASADPERRTQVVCQSALHERLDHRVVDGEVELRRDAGTGGAGPSQWVLVVVGYEQTPARIVSAFANWKGPRSWSA
jgi:hypothetical protein